MDTEVIEVTVPGPKMRHSIAKGALGLIVAACVEKAVEKGYDAALFAYRNRKVLTK